MRTTFAQRTISVLGSLGLIAAGILTVSPAASASVSPSAVTFDCSSTAGVIATTFTGQVGDTFTISNSSSNYVCGAPPNSVVSGASILSSSSTETYTILSAGTFEVFHTFTEPITMTVVIGSYEPPPPPATYTVSLNTDGGSCPVSSLSGTSGTWAALPSDCTKPGYTLSGWSTPFGGSNFAPGQPIALTGNNTLTAQWIRNVQVRIEDPAGFCNSSTEVRAGATYTLPTECARPGYQIKEFTSADGSPVPAGASVTINEDTTFFVQWQQLGTVNFQAGSTCSGTQIEAPVDSTVVPEVSCAPNVVLVGWTTSAASNSGQPPVANGENTISVPDFRSAGEGVFVAEGQQDYFPVVFRRPSTPTLSAQLRFDSLGRGTRNVTFRALWKGAPGAKVRVANLRTTAFECEKDKPCTQEVLPFTPGEEFTQATEDSGYFDYTATVLGEGIVEVDGSTRTYSVPSVASQPIRVLPVLPGVVKEVLPALETQGNVITRLGVRVQGEIVGIAPGTDVLMYEETYTEPSTGQPVRQTQLQIRLLRVGPGPFDVTVYSPNDRMRFIFFKLGGKRAPVQSPVCVSDLGWGCEP